MQFLYMHRMLSSYGDTYSWCSKCLKPEFSHLCLRLLIVFITFTSILITSTFLLLEGFTNLFTFEQSLGSQSPHQLLVPVTRLVQAEVMEILSRLETEAPSPRPLLFHLVM